MLRKTILLIQALMFFAMACFAEAKTVKEIFAMDTYITVTVYGDADEALSVAEELVTDREHLWSTTIADSDIGRVNRAGGECVNVSEDTAKLIALALEMSRSTGGAFDPTVYPLVCAWGFTTGEYRVPANTEISDLLKYVDPATVSVADCEITIRDGMQIDLGGIAKGYAGDEVIQLLHEWGISSALVNLGGNVHTLGCKPDGSAWNIGVKSPDDSGILGIVSVCDRCVITSGAYERFFISEDGVKYGHIIDPRTGYPAENGLLSVTVIGTEGGRCDALSTALFVMGADAACDYWKNSDGFELILLTDDGVLHVTEGIAGSFRKGDSDLVREVCVISR